VDKKHPILYSCLVFIITTLIGFLLDLRKDKIAYERENFQHIETIENQKEQIVKRNIVINTKQDLVYGLIEEKEECITTRKILSNDIKKANQNYNEVHNILDEYSNEQISKEIKQRISTPNVANIATKQLTTVVSVNIQPQKIGAVKTHEINPKKIRKLLKMLPFIR